MENHLWSLSPNYLGRNGSLEGSWRCRVGGRPRVFPRQFWRSCLSAMHLGHSARCNRSTNFYLSLGLLGTLALLIPAAWHQRSLPLLVWVLLAAILLGMIQVIPLPKFILGLITPATVQRRTQLAESFPELNDAWTQVSNTISIYPSGTWTDVNLIALNLAALLTGYLAFRSRGRVVLLLFSLTLLGISIAVFGIIQSVSWNGKMFWTHEVFGGGIPFGPFVCRNNGALLLAICFAGGLGFLYWWVNRAPNRLERMNMLVLKEPSLTEQLLVVLADLNGITVSILLIIGVYLRESLLLRLAAV